jgi:hypothetical protein
MSALILMCQEAILDCRGLIICNTKFFEIPGICPPDAIRSKSQMSNADRYSDVYKGRHLPDLATAWLIINSFYVAIY